MPYCPKCDMEFVDGITTCSDCGGPLVASKEEADRLKREEQLKQQEEQQRLAQEMASMKMNGADADSFFQWFWLHRSGICPFLQTAVHRLCRQRPEIRRSPLFRLRFSHRRRRSPDLLGFVLVTDRPSAYGWIFPLSDPDCSDRHGTLLYGSLHKIKQICQGSASTD